MPAFDHGRWKRWTGFFSFLEGPTTRFAVRKQAICKINRALVFALFLSDNKPDPVLPKEMTAKLVGISCFLTYWAVVLSGRYYRQRRRGQELDSIIDQKEKVGLFDQTLIRNLGQDRLFRILWRVVRSREARGVPIPRADGRAFFVALI